MMITGGCFCGAIQYAIADGDYIVANCHCSMCRRTSAAPFVTWLVVPVGSFRYSKGKPKELSSSASGARFFCESCGTHIACINADHPENVDITAGSLDEPGQFAPRMAVYEDTKLPWLQDTELPP